MIVKPNTRLHSALLSCRAGRHHPAWMPTSIARLELYGLVEKYQSNRLGATFGEEVYQLTAMGKDALAKLAEGFEFNAVER
jgi:hypothetical protein